MARFSRLPCVSDIPAISGFVRSGAEPPRFPVVIAVPHAGRDYPAALLADSAVPFERLRQLEDRYADLLIETAVARGAIAIVMRCARAWIDLNRDPREIDPAMIDGPLPRDLIATVRTRSGLGLIPRRIGNGPHLSRRRLATSEVEERIRLAHAPYHTAIAQALSATRARFGVALLLDCHSMPPVAGPNPRERPDVVIGDRHGRSAATALGDRLESAIRAHGLKSARNAPYAGGYTLDRHGRPEEGIHALQIEFDRSLYLDPNLDLPGPGIERFQRIFNELFDCLAEECDPGSNRVAAE